MEFGRLCRSVGLLIAGVSLVAAQGLNTTATKDDWEEVNFEFNSAVLSDGYPSLLRLAELLHQHPDYRVSLDGNADSIGSNSYNDKLAGRRAETVKGFLVKYGATTEQVSVLAHGKRQPKVSNGSKEGRFMNRRVSLTVRDGQGRLVSAGGIGNAIKAMQADEGPKKCCEEVLKRLDKLDDILNAIKDLKAENDKLKADVDALKKGQAGVEKQVADLPKGPDKNELQGMMDTTANRAIEKAKPNRFSLLGVNIGPSLGTLVAPWNGRNRGSGSVTFTGKGRYFAPFGKDESSAVQVEGEYLYYRDRQEGQFDIGLVNRWQRFQGGLFSSMKHVNLTGIGGATIGQAAFTGDYLFSRGKIGFYGTKSYLTDRVAGRQAAPIPGQTDANGQPVLNYNLWNEYYLRVLDQAGLSTTIGLWDNAYVEGNAGALFHTTGGARPGGTVRLVQPITSRIAGTVEASMNETMLGTKNTGRIAFGVQFGNWVRPKDYLTVKHPVPVDIPRVRYEVLTRQVRTGHTPPKADAGPDQMGVNAGTITLDASGSYSPEGLPLTFKWLQLSGPVVTLASDSAVRTTFTAEAGKTYVFRVTVTDSIGGQDTAKVSINTKTSGGVRILSFAANPTNIAAGGTSTLSWDIEGADKAEISGVGAVNPKSGTVAVQPGQTTTYTLTAHDANGQVSQAVTVTVGGSGTVRILNFTGNPTSINAGQSSTLTWQTEGADTVTISGVGSVAQSGSTAVSPTQTTTYTLTATGKSGSASAAVTISVNGGALISSFTANPSVITLGQTSTLTWATQGAVHATILGIGEVTTNGSVQVSPTKTTTYTLVVTGSNGANVSQQATVTVNPAGPQGPTAFIAGGGRISTQQMVLALDASASTGSGTLTYHWSGPSDVTIFSPNSAITLVSPSGFGDYTFTVTVTDSQGRSSTASVLVTFLPTGNPNHQ